MVAGQRRGLLRKRPHLRGGSRATYGLKVEALEDRRLLTITVDTLVDELDGSIVDGDVSLRDAIAVAVPGETIDFSVTGTINLDPALGQLTIDQDQIIEGPGANQLTIDAESNSRVMAILSGEVTISGLTLTGGYADSGGGLLNDGDAVTTLSEMVITGNAAAGKGGGIESSNSMIIADSTISDNIAGGRGGGIHHQSFAELSILDSVISGNSADDSGGVYAGRAATIQSSMITNNSANDWGGLFVLREGAILNSTISGNSAASTGGGGFLGGFLQMGEIIIQDSTVSDNSAGEGVGGLWLKGSMLRSTVSGNSSGGNAGGLFLAGFPSMIQFSTITGNSAGTTGGGLLGEDATILYSTITGNSAGTHGGGLHVWGGSPSSPHTIDVTGSILSGNAAPLASEGSVDANFAAINLNNHNLIGDSSKTIAQALDGVTAGAGNLTATSDGTAPTPLSGILGPLANNGGPTLTHALTNGSPAIDAGDPAAMAGIGDTPLYDQRGTPFDRVIDGDGDLTARIDIGAFERQEAVTLDCDFNDDGDCNHDDIDALITAIVGGLHDPAYDLTEDGRVDLADRDAWLAEAGSRNLISGEPFLVGDANLDGRVDGQDFIAWNQYKFTATGAWSQGDFNADGQTDGQDFVIWNMFKFQERDAPASLRTDWRPAGDWLAERACPLE